VVEVDVFRVFGDFLRQFHDCLHSCTAPNGSARGWTSTGASFRANRVRRCSLAAPQRRGRGRSKPNDAPGRPVVHPRAHDLFQHTPRASFMFRRSQSTHQLWMKSPNPDLPDGRRVLHRFSSTRNLGDVGRASPGFGEVTGIDCRCRNTPVRWTVPPHAAAAISDVRLKHSRASREIRALGGNPFAGCRTRH
jgi:hypothetical protein